MSKFLVKSAIIVTVSEIIFNLSAFVIHAVVGRILGPADYGRYGLVVTLTTMIIILVGNGIPTAMAKYLSEIFETNPRLIKVIKKQAILLQSLIIGSLTFLFFLSAPLIAKILGDLTLTNLFRISSLIIPAFAAASFYFSYYTGLHKFNIQALLKVSRSVFRIFFIISLAYFFQVKGSIVGYILAPLSVFLLALIIDKFNINKEIKKKIQESSISQQDNLIFPWKNLVNYAWQIVVFFLAYELMISIDLYLVKRILASDHLTGIYNAALTAGRIPYYLFYSLTIILLPAISRSTSANKTSEAQKIINESLRVMFLFLVPLITIMINFSHPIIELFFGHRYLEAAAPMKVLLPGVGFLTVFYVMSFAMNGAGKTRPPMFLAIGGTILNAILNIILIKKYALIGSALATTLTSFFAMTTMLYFVWKYFGKLGEIKSFLKITLAGIGTYFFGCLFPQENLTFIFYSIIVFCFYCLCLYLLDEMKKSDLFFVKDLFTRKK